MSADSTPARSAAADADYIAAETRRLRDDDTPDDTPDDDDAFITDVPRGHSVSFAGKFLGVYVERDAALRAISQAMSDTGFWPNVWYVSDHGNVELITDMFPITEPTDDDDAPTDDAPTDDDAPTGDDAQGFGIEQARSLLEGTAGYAAPSHHSLTFAPDADPADTAKVAARLAKALKPSCMDCGKSLTARDLRAGRLCTDHTGCRLRRILHGPKCPALSYGLA